MSTPRKRWFKCADSLLREPWPREHKLALVLLMAHLNTRWARDGIPNSEAGRCVLSAGSVADITGCKRIRSGFALLAELSLSVSFTVSLENGFVLIDWPKYAEFQYSQSDGGENAGQKKAPSALRSPLSAHKREEEKKSPSADKRPDPPRGHDPPRKPAYEPTPEELQAGIALLRRRSISGRTDAT